MRAHLEQHRRQPKPKIVADGFGRTFLQPVPAQQFLADLRPGLYSRRSWEGCRAELPAGVRLVAIDPGHIDIVNAVVREPGQTEFQPLMALSKREWHRRLGLKKSRAKQREAWTTATQQDVGVVEAALSTHPLGTTDPGGVLAAARVYFRHAPTLLGFYASLQETLRCFTQFRVRQRVTSEVLDRLAPPNSKTVVALGAARFAHSAKGLTSGPILSLTKKLAQRCPVLLVDEYNTTKLSSCCQAPTRTFAGPVGIRATMDQHKRAHQRLLRRGEQGPRRGLDVGPRGTFGLQQKVAYALTKEEPRTQLPPSTSPAGALYRSIHGLRQCSHCSKYWNRDHNAACNIGACFLHQLTTGERPTPFRATASTGTKPSATKGPRKIE